MRFFYPLLTLALISACTSSNDDEPAPEPMPDVISFSISTEAISDSASSRGITINHPSGMSEFKLYAPLWEEVNGGYEFRGYEIEDEIVSKGADDEWTTSIPYYWPQGKRYLNFMAFHPANVEGWSIASSPYTSPDQLRFYYTPPADSKKQHDLLFAFNHEMLNYSGDTSRRVKLTFSHILTNIRFNIVGDAKTVRSITLKNFYGGGGFHPEGSGYMYSWDYNNFENNAPAPRVSYTVDIPEDGVIGDDQTLIIIPQQAQWDSSIEVTMRDGTVYSSAFAYHTFLPKSIRTINVHLPQSRSTSAGISLTL